MIRYVASWDRKYCQVATLLKNKYDREIVLDEMNLELYKLAIIHQKQYLTDDELNAYRSFLLRAASSSVCYDKNFSYIEESNHYKWTKVINELTSDYEFIKEFNNDIYKAWENERGLFVDKYQLDKLKGKSRKAIIKNWFKEVSNFSYSKELSEFGNLVFISPLSQELFISFYIDTGNLNKVSGMPADSTEYLSVALAFYELDKDSNYIRHFMVKFDDLYPISEGLACNAYTMIKNDLDLIALLNLYYLLYKNVESNLIHAAKNDIMRHERGRLE